MRLKIYANDWRVPHTQCLLPNVEWANNQTLTADAKA